MRLSKIMIQIVKQMRKTHQMNQQMAVKLLLLCMEILINHKIFNKIQILIIIQPNLILNNNKSVIPSAQTKIIFSKGNLILIQFQIHHFQINKFLEFVSPKIIFQIKHQILIPKIIQIINRDNFLKFLKYQALDNKIIKIN